MDETILICLQMLFIERLIALRSNQDCSLVILFVRLNESRRLCPRLFPVFKNVNDFKGIIYALFVDR